jgi:hypothetical protein
MLPLISTAASRHPRTARAGNTGQGSKTGQGAAPRSPTKAQDSPQNAPAAPRKARTGDPGPRGIGGPLGVEREAVPPQRPAAAPQPRRIGGRTRADGRPGLVNAVHVLRPHSSRQTRSTYRTGSLPRIATAGKESSFPISSSSSRHPQQTQAWGDRTKLERPPYGTSALDLHTGPAHGTCARAQ